MKTWVRQKFIADASGDFQFNDGKSHYDIQTLLENLVYESLNKCNDTIWDGDKDTKMSRDDFDNLFHQLSQFGLRC